MARRKSMPRETQAQVLTLSRRRCCICFALSNDSSEKKGQIAHLDKDSSNNDFDNLAFLCLDHHDQYDSRTSQSKGISMEEVKVYRSQLFGFIATKLPAAEIGTETSASRIDQIQAPFEPSLIKEQPQASDEVMNSSNIQAILDELRISEVQLRKDLSLVSDLLSRIRNAELPRTQRRLLSLVIENTDGSAVPRRVIESAAGFDYLSSEFYEEMKVLEYRGLLSFSEDPDGEIHLIRCDTETWQLIKYLAEKADMDLRDVIDNPSFELLLPRGKPLQLLNLLGDDFSTSEKDKDHSLESTVQNGDSQTPFQSQPATPRVGKWRSISSLFPKLRLDWKLVVAVLGLFATFFVILYGNNLCRQSSPPPWTMPILIRLCPATPNPIPTAKPSASPVASPSISPTPSLQVINIGVIRIPSYVYIEVVPSLVSMGFDAEWIDYTSDYSDYRDYDIIYFPAGWGYESAVLNERKSSIISFLEQGGGLFIERPNAKDPFVAYFLPYLVAFAPEDFNPLEYPSRVYSSHQIIDGLDPGDLPEAGNLIEDPDDHYRILSVSSLTNHPTLLISEPFEGRVMITSSTIATAEDIRHPLSENLVMRAVLWLIGELN